MWLYCHNRIPSCALIQYNQYVHVLVCVDHKKPILMNKQTLTQELLQVTDQKSNAVRPLAVEPHTLLEKHHQGVLDTGIIL